MIFFFFKQKTAYEMRISDWSSDVCSSDLMVSAWPPSTSAMLALTMPWVSRKSSCTRASTSTMALPMASTLSESVVIPVLSLFRSLPLLCTGSGTGWQIHELPDEKTAVAGPADPHEIGRAHV